MIKFNTGENPGDVIILCGTVEILIFARDICTGSDLLPP
jgi:hypothetical protein